MQDENAAASAIAFVTAGVVFMAAVGAVLYFANNKVPPAQEDHGFVDYGREARAVLKDKVLTNATLVVSGVLQDGNLTAWASANYDDVLVDFGLADLQGGSLANHTRDFHLRIENKTGVALLSFGSDPPNGISVTPADVYLPSSTKGPVRLFLYVFPAWDQQP